MTQIRQNLPSHKWNTTLLHRTKNKQIFKGRLEVCPFYALASAKLGAIPDRGK